jgi:hypothetical protein
VNQAQIAGQRLLALVDGREREIKKTIIDKVRM